MEEAQRLFVSRVQCFHPLIIGIPYYSDTFDLVYMASKILMKFTAQIDSTSWV